MAMHQSGYGYGPLTDQEHSVAETVIAWVLTALTFLYFLPWAVAATRGKSNSLAVGLVNLLVGWTVVGWVVALVMACGAHGQRLAVSTFGPPSPFGPPPLGSGPPSAPGPVHPVPPQWRPHSPPPAPGSYTAPDGPGRGFWDGQRWTDQLGPPPS